MTEQVAKPNPEHITPVVYATFNRRVLAMTVDLVLAICLLFPFTGILSYLFFGDRAADVIFQEILAEQQEGSTISAQIIFNKLGQSNFLLKYLLMQFTGFIMLGFLFVGSWIKIGTTPGKWIAECKILDEKTMLEPSKLQYVVRYLAFIPSNAIGFFALEWDKKHRAWHDRIAGTVVVIKRHNWNKITSFLLRVWQQIKILAVSGYNKAVKLYRQH